MRPLTSLTLLCASAFIAPACSHAQIALSTAVNLALRNSPKVKIAQADVDKARAVLSESKDAFVPAVAATGGVGKSTGAPLNPPVIFSIGAQSLVFNSSQRDYIRAARAGYESSKLALDATRTEVVEDVTNTYLALDNALQRQRTAAEALGFAGRLVGVTEDRFNAGVDPHIELTKSRHTEAQIRLQQLTIEDEIATQSDHLARLTGLSTGGIVTEHASIPRLAPPTAPAPEPSPAPRTGGLSAAFLAADAKEFTAHGQKHYLLRPQVAFSASYSRIATAFTSYTQYYPAFGHAGNSFNSLSLGVEITVPILDMVHRARYHEAEADAARALYEAQSQQMQFLEGRVKLRHSAQELAARSQLAELDRELAQDQLDAVLVRLQSNAGAMAGEQMSPKDEQSARLQERLRTLDMLSAELQLQQVEVSLLRQEGTLSNWISATIPASTPSSTGPSSTPAPAGQTSTPAVPLPPTVGTTPEGAPAPGSAAPSATTPPTVGSQPSTLPTSPVTNPAPTVPGGTPPPSSSGTPHP